MVSGINGSGKTTIHASWLWLLSGYTDAINIKNFNLFDCRHPLSQDTPAASVVAEVEIDGEKYLLERRAIAKFVRKRSTNDWEKAASDEYHTFIDSIEMSSSDFSRFIERNIGPIELLPYCLDGHFFTELVEDKNKARKVLEDVVGEVKREDMKGDYSIIDEDMKRYSVEHIEERTKVELRPLKARMLEIPAIIDSKNDTLAEYKRVD